MNDENLKEILLIMMEEAAEVQQMCSKAIRFGLDDFYPTDPDKETNKERLKKELADFTAMEALLYEVFDEDFNQEEFNNNIKNKLNKLKKWSSIDNKLIDWVLHENDLNDI